mgnify:CR=1 FL=1
MSIESQFPFATKPEGAVGPNDAQYLARAEAAEAAIEAAEKDLGFLVLDAEAFARAPKKSIDYAVMEPAAADGRVAMGTMEVGWSDLGSWASLLAALGVDALIRLHREHGARLHGLAVQLDCAGPAQRCFTADMRAGQAQDIADVVDEEQPGLHLMGMGLAVDGDSDGLSHGFDLTCRRTSGGDH